MNITIDTKKGTTLDRDPTISYTAHIDGKAVGWAHVILYDDGAYLARIDVIDGYQRQGIGTKLIQYMAERHRKICAAPDNPDSQRLFNRLGEDISHTDWGNFDQGFGVYKIW